MSPVVRRRRRARPLRRLRHQLRARPLLSVAAGASLVLILCLVWSLWRAYTVAHDLGEVERNAEILRAALVRGDVDGARSALADYQEAAESAESGVDGPTWWVAEHFPVLGDDAEGVGTVAEVLAGIGREGLPPLVAAAEDVTARSFHPADGTFPLDRIARLAEPARQSQAAFDAAAQRLSTLDPDGYVGPVHTRFDELSSLVSDARHTLGAAYRAAKLMPALLGAEGPRDYLLVMQNNAELRSSGGLPGSLSVIHAEEGHVDIREQRDMAELGATDRPIVPLTDEELSIFGEVLGTVGVDATLTPDFERASELIRARWEQEVGTDLDGIFFVDPVAVSYLLQATGPVAVPGHGTVSAGDVVQKVENSIYLSTPRFSEHSAYQNAVASAVFDAFASGRGEPQTVIRGLAAGVAEGRIRMHSFVPAEQRIIAGTAIAGEFPDGSDDVPRVGVYLNESGETKLSYYLRHEASLVPRSCAGGVQTLIGSVRLTNDTPPNIASLDRVTGTDPSGRRTSDGQQFVVIYLMSPVGGEVIALDYGAGARDPAVQVLQGREVATIGIWIDPEETRTIEFRIRTARGQTGDPELFVTPGAQPGTASQDARSACAS